MGAARSINAETFEKEVVGGDLPAVLDFTATWCGPCQALAPSIEEFATEYEGRVLIGKVDIDENPELTTKLNVASVPTVLFFKNGEKVDQLVGAQPRQAIEKMVEQHL